MWIALNHRSRELRADGIAAKLTPGDEELLVRREPFDGGKRRVALLRDLKGAIGDLRTRQISDAFAENQPTVVVDSRLDKVAVELAHDARCLLAESLQIFLAPPVVEPALRVELRALVVKAVADLVADHHAD